ncbi:glycosyl hydrolase [Chitinophagales bacterium]|nr:glycosyl hydrolase [Chitinophagales bacterium]
MLKNRIESLAAFSLLLIALTFLPLTANFAQTVAVGAGSYTTQFPGVDEAGRNGFPSGNPLTTGAAALKPAPTNDWWSKKIKEPHADNLFTYPYTLKTTNSGLVVSYMPWGVIDAFTPLTMGVNGLNANTAQVSDFSDWTVTMDWSNAGHQFQATAGIGMPFLYFEKADADVATVNISQGSVVVMDEMIVITDLHNGADFAIYAPTGSEWTVSGNNYSSNLNGNNYWSMAFLPNGASSVVAAANEYKKYAYVFPTNTSTIWNYDEASSVLRTEFFVEVDVKEGEDDQMIQGLLPHQWGNLASDSGEPGTYWFRSVRGELKFMEGNAFSVENSFHGILPTLPYVDYLSEGFSPQELLDKVAVLENNSLATWTDSYNEGQVMNELIQTARVADLLGDTEAVEKIVATVKERLEDWLTVEGGEVAFLFYYHEPWSALIGYPAGHGQDNNINDHHFHWGYFIHAASFIEQFEPGWADEWGEIINYLVRDAASDNRDDELFPFLRNFSPYAGHCWANGFATFPQGNDQESSSESMQFNSSLIHWGSITGNDAIRDLGIYLYTTEQTAIEEYWFDVHDRTFQDGQQYGLISRLWGNSYDNGTFWTADIAASYGIELYPIHGGSLYLGHQADYIEELWAEIEQNTGILDNQANPNLWHDIYWEFLAFIDPAKAIELYDSYPDRSLKFGVSDAQTYHWLHSMNALGKVDISLTANHPLATAFTNDEETTYVAHNYSDAELVVQFSDGYNLTVPANSMATSKDVSVNGNLTSNYNQAYPGGTVDLNLLIDSGTATKIEFVQGEDIFAELTEAPFSTMSNPLPIGIHSFYARIYDGANFSLSNIVTVQVGEQVSFLGTPPIIPGTIEAGEYDLFQGGTGQGISYNDVNAENNGDYRESEYVDASLDASEGAIVGWIAAGEWMEYTVFVEDAGNYNLDFRYACGNENGGGPFQIESDGIIVKDGITVTYSGDWANWANKAVNSIPLKSGEQIIRLSFTEGELNLGEMTFSYDSPLAYDQPVANAGNNIQVISPETNSNLNASGSSSPGDLPLTYQWTQVYGPSTVTFEDPNAEESGISNLVDGVYLFELSVTNGEYSDTDLVYVVVSNEANLAPNVSLLSPTTNATYLEGQTVTLSAVASDLLGSITSVAFYVNGVLIGNADSFPFELEWTPELGDYTITVTATNDAAISSTSDPVSVSIIAAPSCTGTSSNGEFQYEFSDASNNPTLTFIPTLSGMGSPTCILYYGTSSGGPLPGYPVTPNVPFQLSISEGATVYFYYTYSYPNQGEHNNAGSLDSYVVGSCLSATGIEETTTERIGYYPNPVSGELNLQLPQGENRLSFYNFTGELVLQKNSTAETEQIDLSNLPAGIYLLHITNGNKEQVIKLIKE